MSNIHTPGPWHFHEQGDANFYAITHFKEKRKEVDWLLVVQHNGEDLVERQRANMRLITAAPEMLKALQGVISHNNALIEEYQISPSLIYKVEQAIKKSTDETV